MDLDQMLALANPSTTQQSPGLQADLRRLAAEPRAARHRSRGRLRWAISGVAVVSILGVGGAAAANGMLPFTWTSAQGGRCVITFASVELASGTDNMSRAAFASTTEPQRQAALQEATRYLEGYNYPAIDIVAAVATWKRAEAAAIDGQPDPAERQPKLEGDQLENQAMIYLVESNLKTHLTEQGLNPDVLVPTFTYEGGFGTDRVFRCAG